MRSGSRTSANTSWRSKVECKLVLEEEDEQEVVVAMLNATLVGPWHAPPNSGFAQCTSEVHGTLHTWAANL